MSTIALTSPYAMTDATLEIGLGWNADTLDDYTAAVSKAQLTPSTSGSNWTGIGGNTVASTSPAAWKADGSLAQDDAPGGLSRFLFDHDNERATIRLTPTAGGQAWKANVTLSATAIGGQAGTLAAGDFSFPVQGKPVPLPTTPGPDPEPGV